MHKAPWEFPWLLNLRFFSLFMERKNGMPLKLVSNLRRPFQEKAIADRVNRPVKRLLLSLFPLFLMLSVYLNLAQNWEGLLSQLRSVTWSSVGVFVYTAALLFLFYFLIAIIVRRLGSPP